MTEAALGLAIIGLINAIQKQFPQVQGIFGIALAVVLGAIAGYYNFGVQGIEAGFVVGLASSGVYKLTTNTNK